MKGQSELYRLSREREKQIRLAALREVREIITEKPIQRVVNHAILERRRILNGIDAMIKREEAK